MNWIGLISVACVAIGVGGIAGYIGQMLALRNVRFNTPKLNEGVHEVFLTIRNKEISVTMANMDTLQDDGDVQVIQWRSTRGSVNGK